MDVKLVSVENSTQRKIFIDFPHELYKDDPFYVPEIYLAMKEHLDPAKNPFFKHSEAHLYLAYDDKKVVGRIAVILNNNYNKYHECNVSFFGFFDCINDAKVSYTLLSKAEEFSREKGTNQLLGPTNFSTNDTAGLLIEGFDSPPVIQMTYNFPYYRDLVENFGFVKDMDLFAYWIPVETVSQKSLNLSDRLKERLLGRGITFRTINMKNFKSEIDKIKQIYRTAWEKNWGFVPPTDEEFDFLAEGLKLMVDDRFTCVCELNGQMIGFAVAMPDVNEMVINFRKGRILPFNVFKLLWGKKRTKKVRVMLLGVVEEHRKLGIEAIFYANLIGETLKTGKLGGEASWVLESNESMVRGAQNLNGQKYKTYRIYSKSI
jgi:hypothetical protein